MKLNRSALRTIEILEYISEQKHGSTLLEIASALDIPKSSVFDIVKTLLYKKVIVEDYSQGKIKYKMGVYAFTIGSRGLENFDLVEISKKYLIDAANHFKATSFLAVLENKMVTYLYKYESQYSAITTANIGTRKQVYCTALGKCMLAFQRKKDVVDDVLKDIKFEPLTEFTITNLSDYVKELEKVKQQGYAVDFREASYYQVCIAAPILNHNKNVVAAISCTFLYEDSLKINEIGLQMKGIGLTISKELGYIDEERK